MIFMPGRRILFAFCVADAALLLLCGWLVPSHISAVDFAVLQRAGENSPSLADDALALAQKGRMDAARWLVQLVQSNHLPGAAKVLSASARPPVAAANQIQELLNSGPVAPGETNGYSQPLTKSVMLLENRDRVLAFLQAAPSPAVRELMRCRDLTNTILPPSSSASGQTFDGALSVCGLLLQQDLLAGGLRDALLDRAAAANRGEDSEPLEQMLFDMMSLGERLNWEQMVCFVRHIGDAQTLDRLAAEARNTSETNLPVLYAAVMLSEKPDAVAAYLGNFSQTGPDDLGAAINLGAGAVDELTRHNQRIFTSDLRQRAAAAPLLSYFSRGAVNYALRFPQIAAIVKEFLYLSGGFLLAIALNLARSAPANGEPRRGRGLNASRELLFALGFLAVVLVVSEPFLVQASQKVDFSLRLRMLSMSSVAATTMSGAKTKLMNNQAATLLILLLFFVLQALIYVACLSKLAEIRGQKVPAPLRLKLLENEEHLFDAGLYLGFCGTIVALILSIMGVSQFSLMSGYSSTAFGIIFVSIFKIFHLRPYRRQLLMEGAGAGSWSETVAPVPASRPTPL
jgi:hypothetical protein